MPLRGRKTFLVSEVFYPDEVSTGYVMTEIAIQLAKDIPVTVICGPVHLESKVFEAKKQLPENIEIIRAKIPRFNKNSIIGRILKMIATSLKLGFLLFKNVKKDDRVVMVTNPPLILLIISWIKRIKGFEWIVIVHDVFPENAVAAGVLKENSYAYQLLLWAFNKAYNKANRLIVVGQDMKELFEQKCSAPLSVITNWADSDEIFPNENLKLEFEGSEQLNGKVIIQFAGNIGRLQAIDEFLDIFDRVKNPDIVFMIIGEGALKEKIKLRIKQNQMGNIILIDALPREMQNTFLNSCNIGLVTLSDRMLGLGVPSKSYNILAAGKPILFIGDKKAEVSRYIHKEDTGWAFSWDEKNEVVDFLENIKPGNMLLKSKGNQARRLVEREFRKDKILSMYKDQILGKKV